MKMVDLQWARGSSGDCNAIGRNNAFKYNVMRWRACKKYGNWLEMDTR